MEFMETKKKLVNSNVIARQKGGQEVDFVLNLYKTEDKSPKSSVTSGGTVLY